jgi:hypothetical protein
VKAVDPDSMQHYTAAAAAAAAAVTNKVGVTVSRDSAAEAQGHKAVLRRASLHGLALIRTVRQLRNHFTRVMGAI